MKVNLFLIGAMRSGSTTLYRYLEQHPEIFMSKVKEPCFFTAEFFRYLLKNKKYRNVEEKNKAEHYIISGRYRTKRMYDSLFINANGFKFIGEASHYIHQPKIAEIIHSYNPESKIIATLRNPIDRVYSEYMLKIRTKGVDLSFYDFLMTGLKWENDEWTVESGSGLPKGFYTRLLNPWIRYFGKDNVRICLFDDLVTSPMQVCSDLFSWLGVDPNFKPAILHTQRSGRPRLLFANAASFSKNPVYQLIKKMIPPHIRIHLRDILHKIVLKRESMDQKSRELLRNIYRDDIHKLQGIIQKDLSHWN